MGEIWCHLTNSSVIAISFVHFIVLRAFCTMPLSNFLSHTLSCCWVCVYAGHACWRWRDLTCRKASDLLQQLVFDMRSHCMERLLEQAISGRWHHIDLLYLHFPYLSLTASSLSFSVTFSPYISLCSIFLLFAHLCISMPYLPLCLSFSYIHTLSHSSRCMITSCLFPPSLSFIES